jgi:hypothetical protein
MPRILRFFTIYALLFAAYLTVQAQQPETLPGPALNSPDCIKVPEDRAEQNTDEVMTVGRRNEFCAYPLRLMSYHRIVNDHLGGLILVTYDADSGIGQMYDRSIDGKEINFDASPTVAGVPMMRDRETKTLWSQLTGEALEGPLKGKRLARVNTVIMTWERWKSLQPESYVLKEDPKLSPHYVVRNTPAACPIPTSIKQGLPRKMDRHLASDALVIGVSGTKTSRVYPLSVLDKSKGIISDTIDGLHVALFSDTKSRAAAAYFPEVKGKQLTFTAQDRNGVRVYLDTETQSVWTLEGRAVEGPLKGAELSSPTFARSRWYAWSSAFPQTQLYRPRRAESPSPFSRAL